MSTFTFQMDAQETRKFASDAAKAAVIAMNALAVRSQCEKSWFLDEFLESNKMAAQEAMNALVAANEAQNPSSCKGRWDVAHKAAYNACAAACGAANLALEAVNNDPSCDQQKKKEATEAAECARELYGLYAPRYRNRMATVYH